MTAADTETENLRRAMEGFRGLTEDGFEGTVEESVIYSVDAWHVSEFKDTPAYDEAYEMGKRIK